MHLWYRFSSAMYKGMASMHETFTIHEGIGPLQQQKQEKGKDKFTEKFPQKRPSKLSITTTQIKISLENSCNDLRRERDWMVWAAVKWWVDKMWPTNFSPYCAKVQSEQGCKLHKLGTPLLFQGVTNIWILKKHRKNCECCPVSQLIVR